jgi:hypothetical protein
VVVLKHLSDGCGLHLTAPVIDHLRAFILGHIEDSLIDETPFKKLSDLIGSVMPADQPVGGFTEISIQQQIQIEIYPLLIGEKVADILAPPLVRCGEFPANRSH